MTSPAPTALHCLAWMARRDGIELSPEMLAEDYDMAGNAEPDSRALARAAQGSGYDIRREKGDWGKLLAAETLLPMMIGLANGRYVVVIELRHGTVSDSGITITGDGATNTGEEDPDSEKVVIFDPLAGRDSVLVLERAAFERGWNDGDMLLLRRHEKSSSNGERLNFAWFYGLMRQQPMVLAEIAGATFLLHLLSFAMPMFTMVTLDRVISTHSYETLHVLFFGAVVAVLCHSVLGALRSLLLQHAVGRIDIRLAELSYKKLLSLPLDFFNRSSAGSLVKHMGQTTQLREFMAGTLLATLLEALAIFLFLPVLLAFSFKLTLVVLGTTVLIALNLFAVLKAYRRRLQETYVVEGERQAMLVETISGIETVKSLALERGQTRRWLDRSARQVMLQFRIGSINTVSAEISGFLQKLMGLLIIWLGVMLVLSGEITVGALVAFNLMSSKVSMPLVQLIQLLSKFEQAGLSLAMLGGVVSQPGERRLENGSTRTLRGKIRFEGVGFRYGPGSPVALDGLSMEIPQGAAWGIVGRSGSGKSTLARLLQGLYLPWAGVIRIDGLDIREYNLPHLRRQIGVVPQTCHLFRGTIRDNIAIGNEGCSPELVLEAARLAGVSDFAETLPLGYDTFLEEDGSNISMGQRQRIALARALVKRPAILLLDEATSALDPETEAQILRHFNEIAAGRTVLMISHRLATMTHLDALVVLDRGRIVDIGPHDELLRRCALYRTLWESQMAPIARRRPATPPPARAAVTSTLAAAIADTVTGGTMQAAPAAGAESGTRAGAGTGETA